MFLNFLTHPKFCFAIPWKPQDEEEEPLNVFCTSTDNGESARMNSSKQYLYCCLLIREPE